MSDITMDDKYAYRGNPRAQVRVLCVDRKGDYPVLAMANGQDLSMHYVNGAHTDMAEAPFDLVPLDETLAVTPGTYRTRGGYTATIALLRDGQFGRYGAVGWVNAPPHSVDAWKLDGEFTFERHRFDLVERIGDLP